MSLDTYPYPSRRSVVLSTGGMVASSQPLAAQAGVAALRAGGSAVDAALATAITLTVVEPTSNGIGSDAFAIVWDGEKLHGLNASGPAPRALSADALRAAGHTVFPERGWTSVSVPGAPDAWGVLHERFGRVPFDSLFAAAIRLAEDGFPVSPVVSQLWRRAGLVFIGAGDSALDDWARVFTFGGRIPDAGEVWRSAGHAATLHRLASEGPRDFYEGALAARIAQHAQATGGMLDGDDLAAFHSEWVEPISIAYRDHEVWEIPPNGQGIAALQAPRHRRRHRHARIAARKRRELALPDRGDEARVRGRVPIRGRSASRRRAGERHARCRLPRLAPGSHRRECP